MKTIQKYWKINLLLIFLMSINIYVKAQEQNAEIIGIVVDEFQKPLKDVIITSVATRSGTSSDFDGNFVLKSDSSKQKVRFELEGYHSIEVDLEPEREDLVILLLKDNHELDKVIDLGYTTTTFRNLTGAVSSVSGSELERHPVANLSQTFAGRLAGLTTQETFSELSRVNTDLFIRGVSAARKGDPLVIIDGIPTSYNSGQSLEYISPNEIESINILKDASTQAIYGIQGANGVIVVKTKRGKKGDVEIKARLDQSFQQVTTKPLMLNSLQYAELSNQAGVNDGLGAFSQFSENTINHYRSGDSPELYPSNNWYDKYFKDFASMQRIGVNVTGGNDKITYFSNLNFMHQGGYFNTDTKEYNPNPKNVWVNYRSNVDVQFNNYLSGYLRLSGNVKRERVPGGGSNEGVYGSMFLMPPTTYGPLTPEILDPQTGEVMIPGGQVVTTDRINNPTYGILNRSGYINHTVTNISSQFGLNLDMSFLTEGLKLSGVFAYQTNSVGSLSNTQSFERYMRSENWDKLEFTKKGEEQNSPLGFNKGHSYYYHLTYKGQLDYSRSFGKHNILASAYGLFQDLTKANTNAPELLPYKRLSTGAQAEYNYDNRYMLKAVFGYSGSEQYSRAHRYLFTPAFGASWIASNESFLEGSKDWLSLLKFRGSWGKTANDQSGLQRYAYLDQIVVHSGGPLGYLQYLVVENQTGNPNIQAEVSTKTNFGVDLGLFNSITFSGDIFKERMENMIVGAVSTIPSYQGIPLSNYPRINEGIFDNKGYELSLRYDRIINAKTSFYVQGMFSKNDNKIVSWNEAERTADFAYRKREEGYSLGQEFGYLVDYSQGNGFFNSQAEIDASGLTYGFGEIRPGDLRYQDLNSDGTIDERDLGPIGSGVIPKVTYSFAGGLKYAAFDMNFIFQGIGKYSGIMTGNGIWETSNGGLYSSLHQHAWTAERYANNEEITWPALSTEKSVNHEGSDFVNFNKTYLRLRNVELGYTFQRDKTRFIGFDQIRIVLSGQNLFTWDKMKTKDFGPEGPGYMGFPVYRVYSFGVNLML